MKKIMVMLIALAMLIFPAAALAEAAMPETIAVSGGGAVVDVTEIIITLMALVFDILLVWLAKTALPSIRAWLDERTSASQREMIYTLIEKLVDAAEQVIGAGKGHEKLQYVIAGLQSRGVKVDIDLIEAAVKEMNDRALREIETNLVKEIETKPPDESTGKTDA